MAKRKNVKRKNRKRPNAKRRSNPHKAKTVARRPRRNIVVRAPRTNRVARRRPKKNPVRRRARRNQAGGKVQIRNVAQKIGKSIVPGGIGAVAITVDEAVSQRILDLIPGVAIAKNSFAGLGARAAIYALLGIATDAIMRRGKKVSFTPGELVIAVGVSHLGFKAIDQAGGVDAITGLLGAGAVTAKAAAEAVTESERPVIVGTSGMRRNGVGVVTKRPINRFGRPTIPGFDN